MIEVMRENIVNTDKLEHHGLVESEEISSKMRFCIFFVTFLKKNLLKCV